MHRTLEIAFPSFQISIFSGSMAPDPPRGKRSCGPFSSHSHLLHLQWPLITKVIETPEINLLKFWYLVLWQFLLKNSGHSICPSLISLFMVTFVEKLNLFQFLYKLVLQGPFIVVYCGITKHVPAFSDPLTCFKFIFTEILHFILIILYR